MSLQALIFVHGTLSGSICGPLSAPESTSVPEEDDVVDDEDVVGAPPEDDDEPLAAASPELPFGSPLLVAVGEVSST